MKSIAASLALAALSAFTAFGAGCAATTEPEAGETADELTARVLKLGDSGTDVVELQVALMKIGYELTADGKFGPGTEAVVANFQTRNAIQATKQVGATTMAAIRKVAQSAATVAPLRLPAGYYEVTAGTTRVVNNCALQAGTKALDARPGSVAPSAYGNFDLVVNGTFSLDDSTTGASRSMPAGAVVRGGVLEATGFGKTSERGGVAVLKDGSVRVIRQRGAGLSGVQSALGSRVLESYIGGGALLIENGQLVSSADLMTRQKFDQGTGGMQAPQMSFSQHTVVAIDAAGRPHIVLSIQPKSGAQLQQDLMKAGIVNAVKLDGSSGFIARTNASRALGGDNGNCCSGFAVKIRR
jgi:peptidoglycan hydrolase-like protein with peptidoglycan-binding domain